MKVQPLKERVFVKYSSEEERTKGGLYIPDSAKEKPQRGTVQAVGSEVKGLKKGDQILFDRYSGSKIKLDDEEYLIIKEEDILGILS